MIKHLIVASIGMLILSCNNGKTNTDKKILQAVQANEQAQAANTGKSFLTATVQEQLFTATNEVYATEITEGGYYAIGAQNENYTIALQIPTNKSMGSFTCEGSFVNNKTKQGFNADAVAVTIEEKADSYIVGTFTMLATDVDGNIQSAKGGKFKALINKQ
ncbi:MAG: hypothetical protein KA319_11190 [Ferruginibacter sp.]|nr:hypothetical protein [Ferruginibacter sp.]